jgi:hypothetical protein
MSMNTAQRQGKMRDEQERVAKLNIKNFVLSLLADFTFGTRPFRSLTRHINASKILTRRQR